MKIKKILGYILIAFLVVSNGFNYSTVANYKTEFNMVTETIMSGDQDLQFGKVTISHVDIESGEKLVEDEGVSEILEKEILGETYKKDIRGYNFVKAVPEKIIVSAESNELKLYYKKAEVDPEEKYVDVTIHHYLIDSTEKVIEDELLQQVKVGSVLTSKDYVKAIEGYEFATAVPEVFTVTEENKEISLYYKEIKDPEPVKVDVQVLYYDLKDQELAEPSVIQAVETGVTLKARDYLKTIEGYEFAYGFPEILEVREDNHCIKLYYKENQVEPPVEFVNVTVNHLLTGTDTKIAESDVLEKIKVGEILEAEQYKKELEGYVFEKTEFKTLEVKEDNNVINIYYKKAEEEKPKPPTPGKEDPSLPQTGQRKDYLWIGYILILLGVILRMNKKEKEPS